MSHCWEDLRVLIYFQGSKSCEWEQSICFSILFFISCIWNMAKRKWSGRWGIEWVGTLNFPAGLSNGNSPWSWNFMSETDSNLAIQEGCQRERTHTHTHARTHTHKNKIYNWVYMQNRLVFCPLITVQMVLCCFSPWRLFFGMELLDAISKHC